MIETSQASQRGMDRRIVAQLFDSIDSISSLGERESANSEGSLPMAEAAGLTSTASSSSVFSSEPGHLVSASSGAAGVVVLIVATNK